MKRNLKRGTKQRRQISALERLEKQLESGKKNLTFKEINDGSKWSLPLTDKDIKRIKKERLKDGQWNTSEFKHLEQVRPYTVSAEMASKFSKDWR